MPIAASFPYSAASAATPAAPAAPAETPFDPSGVRRLAQELAQKAFVAPDAKLPDNLKDLDYDKYRKIRFVPDKAIWRGDGLPFQLQLFHRGFFFSNRVDLFEVSQGKAQPIHYSPSLFTFDDVPPPPPDA